MSLAGKMKTIMDNQLAIYNSGICKGHSTQITAFYNSVADAVAGSNPVITGKVGAYTNAAGIYTIVLLASLEEGSFVGMDVDTILDLNGYVLTLLGDAYLKSTAQLTIIGTKPGSKIIKTRPDVPTNTQFLVYCAGTGMKLCGGSYSLLSRNDATQAETYCIVAKCALEAENCVFECCNDGITEDYRSYLITAYCQMHAKDCTFSISGKGKTKYAIVSYAQELRLDRCTINGRNEQTGANCSGVYCLPYDFENKEYTDDAYITIKDCNINIISEETGGGGYGIYAYGGYLNVINCDVQSTNDGDSGGIAIAGNADAYLSGSTFFGSREAYSLRGAPALISNCIFEGCRHGGAYFSGEVRVKNSTFRQAPQRGGLEYKFARYGVIYTSTDTRLYMDHCTVETCEGLSSSHGIVCNSRYDNIVVFLSNITFVGKHSSGDLRIDRDRTIFVGENVQYRSIYTTLDHQGNSASAEGIVDTETYADVEFAWDEEGNILTPYYDRYLQAKDAGGIYDVEASRDADGASLLSVTSAIQDPNLYDASNLQFAYTQEADKAYPSKVENGKIFSGGSTGVSKGAYLYLPVPAGQYLIEAVFSGETTDIEYGFASQIVDGLFSYKEVTEQVTPTIETSSTTGIATSYISHANLSWAPTAYNITAVKLADGTALTFKKTSWSKTRIMDASGNAVRDPVTVTYLLSDTASSKCYGPDWVIHRKVNLLEPGYIVYAFWSATQYGCSLDRFSIKDLNGQLLRSVESFDPTTLDQIEKITVNGYTVDTAGRNAVSKGAGYALTGFYDTVADALTETNPVYMGKLATFKDGNGRLNILLLSDLELSSNVITERSCVIQLNGHSVRLTDNAIIYAKADIKLDGTVEGSRLYKEITADDSITDSIGMIVAAAGKVELDGGTYNLDVDGIFANEKLGVYLVNTIGELTAQNCSVKCTSHAGGSTAAAIMARDAVELRNCSIEMDGNAKINYAIYCRSVSLRIEDSSIKATTSGSDTTAKALYFFHYDSDSESYTECTLVLNHSILQAVSTAEDQYANAVDFKNSVANISNCEIVATGAVAIRSNGECTYSCSAVSGNGNIRINDCTCYASREGLSVHGSPLIISGGTYEGTCHGNYLSGEVRAKNATFKNGLQRGDVPYAQENRLGVIYTSANTNLHMDACLIVATDADELGTTPSALYGIVCNNRYDNVTVYLSNIEFEGFIAADLRIDYGRTIYLGENVPYRNVYFGINHQSDTIAEIGVLDTASYDGVRFTWDVDGNVNGSYLNGLKQGKQEIYMEIFKRLTESPEIDSFANRFRCSTITEFPPATMRGSISQVFYKCYELESVGPLNTDECTIAALAFGYCYNLKSVELTALTGGSAVSTFQHCYKLQNVVIGSIGANISFAWSPLLTLDSAKTICTALVTYAGGTHTITLPEEAVALLDGEANTAPGDVSWRQYIQDKGWTLIVKTEEDALITAAEETTEVDNTIIGDGTLA